MQSGGQYGLPDMQQFILKRGAPQAFAHSQDVPPAHHFHQLLQPQQHQQQQPHQEPQAFHQHQHSHGLQPQQYDQLSRLPLQLQQTQQQPLNFQLQPYQKAQPSLHLPPSLQLPPLQHQGLGSESADTLSSLATQPHAGHFKPVTSNGDPLGDDDEVAEEGDRRVGNRWPREETSALLRIRSDMDAIFRDPGSKVSLWEEVSRKLSELGYHRSAKKCKEKFENVHKYIKKTKDGSARRQDGKSYRFVSDLEALYTANNDEGGASSEGGVAGTNVVFEHGETALLAAGDFPAAAVEGALPSQRLETSSGLNFSSTSSGENYDEPHDMEDRKSRRKRKRKSWCSVKMFFENLARQVMEQQEALHERFLDMVERRDQERVAREEAYKRQEMVRLNREHELRAQEHALAATRDAALVAFLQKVTGQTLQLPQMPVPPNLATSSDVLDDQEKEGSDINTRRWPKAEVHALIRLRSGLEPRFQEAGPKAQLWEEISASMACMGFHRSAKRCKEKWENINKYFRKTKDSSKKRLDNAKTCPYFHQLEALYQKGILASPNSKLSKLEGHSDIVLENTKEDSGQPQIGNSETLAIVPFGESGAGCSTSSPQLCTNQGKGQALDQGSKGLPESNVTSQPTSSPLSFDKFHNEDVPGCNKSMPVEGFVREILEMQQEQHQKLVDEYDRMERARDRSEQELRLQHELRLAQERSHSTIRDNAGLMALVHKLAGDSSEFTMAAPSGNE